MMPGSAARGLIILAILAVLLAIAALIYMPLNESLTHQSELTLQQQREAQAAVYGLPAPQPDNLSPEDIQRMRMIIARYDNSSQAPVREFDLNKPPRDLTLAPGDPAGQAPYRYQAFPRILYDHGKRVYRTVHHSAEMELCMAAGWRTDPYPAEPPPEPELDAATQAEVAAADAELKKKKPSR